jgi:signal transduction histidine kinase
VLLAQGARISERLRISRDLHDLIGHHLTALTLNLEVASHMVEGRSKEHIEQAKSVAKLLLTDVREVVSTMREQGAIELSQALHTLAEGIPRPVIHLEMPENLLVEDPQRAQVILRCTQEIITNSLKHAQAGNLWLNIKQDQDGLSIHAKDDGTGTNQLEEGNGLLGMGERLRQLGGKLSIESDLGDGFSLNAWLPAEVIL